MYGTEKQGRIAATEEAFYESTAQNLDAETSVSNAKCYRIITQTLKMEKLSKNRSL